MLSDEDFDPVPSRETAWQRREQATAVRKRLLASGFLPIPVNGKKPLLPGWPDIKATDPLIHGWEREYPDALNTGILTRTTPVFDIDILNAEAAEAVEALARERFEERGYFLTRTGLAPKRAILFRVDVPFEKIRCVLMPANGAAAQKLELLGRGQQVVVKGIHPDTGQPYMWHGGEPGQIRHEELPYITREEAGALVADAARLLVEEFGYAEITEKQEHKKDNGADHGAKANGSQRPASERERAYAAAALDACADELAQAPSGSRNDMLNKKAFRLGTMVARRWIDRNMVEQVLFAAAADCGLNTDDGEEATWDTIKSGLDAGERTPHPDLNGDTTWENVTEPGPFIKSSAEFVTGFIPPDYIVEGILQRGFLYSLTGQTGSGKTAITLRLATSTALGQLFAGRETKKLRALYLAAENADDVRMRWIALAQHMGFAVDAIEVYFIEGCFKISGATIRLQAEAEKCGGEFGLVIVDTSPAFFEGDDESSRAQMGKHARMLRGLIEMIPGRPCIVANCHPVKNATEDNLLPAGGGTFLNEVDGNLTAFKNDSTVDLHWQGKFRGPEFAPMHFLIRTVTHQNLTDSKGRLIPTVICEWISEQRKEEIAAQKTKDEETVLALIDADPKISQAEIATQMQWTLYSGQPHKTKAARCVAALIKAKLVKETRRGRFQLTPEGKKILAGEEEKRHERLDRQISVFFPKSNRFSNRFEPDTFFGSILH
jgi:hypothetical protein